MPPSISIILPTYDRLDYLREAVYSALAQTIADWELIIVDDGSTDGTLAWLATLDDARIRVVPLAHSGNIPYLRNVGLTYARAKWIAFLDSDDRWKSAKLERQLTFHADHPSLRWSYTRVDIIDERGDISVDARRKPWTPHAGRIVAPLLELDATIALPSVIVERALLEEAGGFDEKRQWVEDQDLWLRLACRAECGLIDEPLIDVRAHHSITFDRPEVELGFVEMYRAFANQELNPAFRALARRSASLHAVGAANRLAKRRRWREAWAAFAIALRLRPGSPFVYGAAARLARRQLFTAAEAKPALYEEGR
jgi:glycosyltransferase involved in cell wall biosynthesis